MALLINLQWISSELVTSESMGLYMFIKWISEVLETNGETYDTLLALPDIFGRQL